MNKYYYLVAAMFSILMFFICLNNLATVNTILPIVFGALALIGFSLFTVEQLNKTKHDDD